MSNPYSNPYVSNHRNRTKDTAIIMVAMGEEEVMEEDNIREEAMEEGEEATITTLTSQATMDMVIIIRATGRGIMKMLLTAVLAWEQLAVHAVCCRYASVDTFNLFSYSFSTSFASFLQTHEINPL